MNTSTRQFKIGDKVKILDLGYSTSVPYGTEGIIKAYNGTNHRDQYLYYVEFAECPPQSFYEGYLELVKSKFKSGDVLKQIKAGNDSWMIGQIIKLTSDGPTFSTQNDGVFTQDYLEDNFELVQKSSTEFEVGDIVECIYNDNGSGQYVGGKYEIVRVNPGTKHPYMICDGTYFSSEEISLLRKANTKTTPSNIKYNCTETKSTFVNRIEKDLEELKNK
jgi:hypothetical protein